MTRRPDDPHTLAGAYVMDAVDTADRVRFEQHLAGCEPCQQEIRGLRETAAALAAASAITPRAAFRDGVLRAATRTRQLPPLLSRDAGAGQGRPRARMRRLALGLTAGVAAVAVGLGVVSYAEMRDRLDQAQGSDHTVAAVLSAPDASMVTRHVSTGGTVTVVASRRMRMLVLTAAGLHGLPAAQRYEIWLIGPAGSRSGGMIDGSGHGKMVGPMVVSGLSAGDSVGLTVEPAGGSPKPTSPPVLLIALFS
jgi:anti-sigma-K factor RskA